MNKMKIAISFGDNDFYYTFTGVLATLHNAIKFGHSKFPTDKDKLVRIINELSFGHYLSHQNQFRYDNNEDEKHYEHIRQYLKIDKTQLFLNEEVRSLSDWENGEVFILDTENEHSPIYSL